jgi:hypothetical protein
MSNKRLLVLSEGMTERDMIVLGEAARMAGVQLEAAVTEPTAPELKAGLLLEQWLAAPPRRARMRESIGGMMARLGAKP